MEQNWKTRLKELWKKEKWYWMGAVAIGVIFSLIFGAHWTKGYSEMIQNGISAKVVRFHVLANSDIEKDQALKLAVRDRVLQEYGELLQNCENKEETLQALEQTGRKTLAVAGGVAANSHIRAALVAECEKRGVRLCMPPLSLCGDNAAMIGAQGYYEYLAGNLADQTLNAYATKSFEGEQL